MSKFLFGEQVFSNGHASADNVVTDALSTDHTINCLADLSRITPDNSWANAGLSAVYGAECVWSADQPACPATASISNQINAPLFSTPFLHQSSLLDGVTHFWSSPLCYPSVRYEPKLDRVGDTFIPRSDLVHTITLSETRPARKQTARCSQSRRTGASRLPTQSVAPRSRNTSYPTWPDIARRGDLHASIYPCQWFDGAGPCNAVVTGTKGAIGQHLKDSHTIQLKADKSHQVCHWEGCQKPMRAESIPRHILAVHMEEKVLCPGCGMRFARADSMLRHQKTCLATGEVGEQLALRSH